MTNKTAVVGALKICLIAGETSGDVLGGQLMAALKKNFHSPIEFVGIGGEKMREQGLESLFSINELSIMGIFEILPHIPKIMRRIEETVAYIKFTKPDVVVTIDSPDFTLRIAKKLRSSNMRLIHYVAPSVWAWKAWRARKMSQYLDRVLTLFHFEPPYFEAAGLHSVFVGHPILESRADKGNGKKFRSNNGLTPDVKLICVLPGSRLAEATKHLPIIKETLALLGKKIGPFEVVIPLSNNIASYVKNAVREWPNRVKFTEDDEKKFDAFAASNAAIAASGTVALELAMAAVPYVTIYKMTLLSNLLARIIVKIKYVNLVNILLDKEVVPELLLEKCKPKLILTQLERSLNDDEFKSNQIINFETAIGLLGADSQAPSERAAHAVLDSLPLHATRSLTDPSSGVPSNE